LAFLRSFGSTWINGLIRRVNDFPEARENSRGSERAQPYYQTQQWNVQISKNNIQGQGYQAVAKCRRKVSPNWNLRFLKSLLGH
jgi:hypothetical protein